MESSSNNTEAAAAAAAGGGGGVDLSCSPPPPLPAANHTHHHHQGGHTSQFYPTKPSALRMPSPSLRYFSMPQASTSHMSKITAAAAASPHNVRQPVATNFPTATATSLPSPNSNTQLTTATSAHHLHNRKPLLHTLLLEQQHFQNPILDQLENLHPQSPLIQQQQQQHNTSQISLQHNNSVNPTHNCELHNSKSFAQDKAPALTLKWKSLDESKQDALTFNAAPFSDEWLAAIEDVGEGILTMKTGPVQNSPPDKSLPEPGPWSPVKRKNNPEIGPFDCTKYTNLPPPQLEE